MAHWPDRQPAKLGRSIEIERRSKLSPDECMARFLIGEGLPVVVTDAQDDWAAAKLWSVDYFRKRYGDEELIASDRAPLRFEDNPPMRTLRVTIGEFCDYMTSPHHGSIASAERDSPFYGNSWSPLLAHEEMRGHIGRPYFVPDSVPADGDFARLDRSFTKVFLGPAGTVTRLHNDTFHTHAWLSQIRGTKQFVLYPPSQAHLIHAGEGVSADHGSSQTWFDPMAPDWDAFPRAKHATPYVAVCGPGDTILVPSDWFHHAVSLTPSITLMRNFFNDHNARGFFEKWNAHATAKAQGSGARERPAMSTRHIPPPALPPPVEGAAEPGAASRRPLEASPAYAEETIPNGEVAGGMDFSPAESFGGARGGFVFKMGARGLGYYADANATRGENGIHADGGMSDGGGGSPFAAVTIDHGRSIVRLSSQRQGQLVARPAFATPSASAQHESSLRGSACATIAPLEWEPYPAYGEHCGRRTGVAWRWSAPRRAVST